MLQAELRAPGELRTDELQAWAAFRAAEPAFASPLLSPAFAAMVGAVRGDVRVAVLRDATGEVVGLFPHHRRPSALAGAFARGLGGPWSDEQALLTGRSGLDGREALAAAGLRACRFTGLIDPHGAFAGSVREGEEAYAIALEGSGEAYFESLRAASPKKFKNLRRLESKLGREHGDVELTAHDADPEALAALVGWKRDQFRRTGVHDVLGPDWSRALIERAFTADGDVRGLLITLKAGGKVIAGHFGLREGGVYHPWIAAFDPAFAAYSPGMILIACAVRAMNGLGLTRYELSGGCGHYKAAFANELAPVKEGLVSVRGPALAAAPRRPVLLERVRRRLDQIVETELTLAGRLGGVAGALHGIPRRFASPHARPEEA